MDEVIYSPESRIRHPLALLREMLRSAWASRELAWRLTVRDISAQYRQSLLGYTWAFVPPVAAALIFIFLNKSGVFTPGETSVPYPVFVTVGTVLWQTFVESVNAPMKTVTAAKSTMAKINFPHEALALSAIGQVLFGLIIKAVIIVAVFVAFRVPVTWGAALSVPATMVLILFGTAVGALFTPLAVLFNDFAFGLTSVLSLWFFITPVVYQAPQSSKLALAATLNPAAPPLIAARDLLTLGNITNLEPFLIVAGLTLLALLFIWVLFRLSIPLLIERMSA